MNSPQLLLIILDRKIPTLSLREEIRGLKPSDWEQILLDADNYGVTYILNDRLQNLGTSEFVPEEILKRLKASNLMTAGRNMKMLHHAAIILRAFREQNLDVIVLKGIYLIEEVYQSIGMRIFGDLDLLIRKKDLQTAEKIMKELGYELSTWYDPEDPNQDIKHLPPMFKPNAPPVELHWSILQEDSPFDIDIDGLWERAVPANISDVEVLALGYEDLILHLCMHLTYQHRVRGGLRNLYDIVQVIEKYEDQIDWDKLVWIAKSWKVEKVIWLTFNLMDEILGFKVPNSILDQLLADAVDSDIIAQARSQLLFNRADAVLMTPDLADLSSLDGLFPKIRLVLSRIFLPRRVMARLYNIPPNSVKIYSYYGVRLKELYRHYSPSAWQLLKKDQKVLAGAENEHVRGGLIGWMEKR